MKVEKTDKYIKITSDDGMYLTDYVEGEDIMKFNAFRTMFAPLNADIEGLKEIDEGTYNNIINKIESLDGKDR